MKPKCWICVNDLENCMCSKTNTSQEAAPQQTVGVDALVSERQETILRCALGLPDDDGGLNPRKNFFIATPANYLECKELVNAGLMALHIDPEPWYSVTGPGRLLITGRWADWNEWNPEGFLIAPVH